MFGPIFAIIQQPFAVLILSELTLSVFRLLFSIDILSNQILIFDSAFYDGGVTSHNAGDFVFHTVVPALKAACPGEKLMITEWV